MKTAEGKIKDQIKTFLEERGCYQSWPVPAGYGMPTVDCIGCYKGHFFAIETKAPGKRPTPRQQLIIENMQYAGAYVLWGDNAEDIIQQLLLFFNDCD